MDKPMPDEHQQCHNENETLDDPEEPPPIPDRICVKHNSRLLDFIVLFQSFSFLDTISGGNRFHNPLF